MHRHMKVSERGVEEHRGQGGVRGGCGRGWVSVMLGVEGTAAGYFRRARGVEVRVTGFEEESHAQCWASL